jgi:hypothetical protein
MTVACTCSFSDGLGSKGTWLGGSQAEGSDIT